MRRVDITDVDQPPPTSPASVRRPLSRPLETTDVALNYFELAPGETFGFDYHRHLDQEEVFYVLSGTATFRTETGDVEVASGEVIRFEPGEFQLGQNEGSERLVALGIGAPRGTTEMEHLRRCATCDGETIQTVEVERDIGVVRVVCKDCGSTVDEIELESRVGIATRGRSLETRNPQPS